MCLHSSKLGLGLCTEGDFCVIPKVCRRHPYKKIHVPSLKQAWTWLMDFFAEGGGFEPPVRLPVRQFSKLLVSATHPSFLSSCESYFGSFFYAGYCVETEIACKGTTKNAHVQIF